MDIRLRFISLNREYIGSIVGVVDESPSL